MSSYLSTSIHKITLPHSMLTLAIPYHMRIVFKYSTFVLSVNRAPTNYKAHKAIQHLQSSYKLQSSYNVIITNIVCESKKVKVKSKSQIKMAVSFINSSATALLLLSLAQEASAYVCVGDDCYDCDNYYDDGTCYYW